MGYLVLTRKEGEKITLRVQPGTDADDLLAQLLDGITISVLETSGTRARIGIEAPQDLQICGVNWKRHERARQGA